MGEPAEAAGAEDEDGEETLAALEAAAAQRHACFDFDELDAKPRELFVDPAFPPTEESVRGATGCGLECYKGLQWLRPEQLDPVPDLFAGGSPRGTAPAGASNVIQGQLDDCYLISAISLLTLDGPLLRRLFASYLPEEGRCVVRLFLCGEWVEIEVDTLLPCDRGEPAFARSLDGTEVYACLLEKALAKVYGSFHALTGGNMGEALHDLTGTAVEDVNLTKIREHERADEVWRLLRENRLAKNLIACGRTTANGEAKAADAQAQGLLVDHAYSVMALAEPRATRSRSAPKLVRVVNPWGHFVWQGAWSSESEEWTDALREELQYDGTDAGAFWMELADFVQFFNRLHVCRSGPLRERECARRRFCVETSLDTAGGCSNFPSFYKNTMFRVAPAAGIAGPLEVFATVSQPDARRDIRSTPGARMTYPQMGITLLAQEVVAGVVTDAKCCAPNRSKVLQLTSFWNKREVSMTFNAAARLPRGREFRVVPSCFFPDDPGMGRFVLHFYWKGSEDDLVVERIEDAALTAVKLSGSLASTHGDSLFGQQPCYRVFGPDSSVPISVVLTKAPKLLRQWYRKDPLHAALRAVFEAFDANASGALERQEMRALLGALADVKERQKVTLQEEAKDAIFREFDRTGSGAVTFGQFVAQSSALLAVLRVPKAELRGYVEGLARKVGRESQLLTASAAAGHSSAVSAAAGVFAAVAPLRCHPAEYEEPQASVALGCGGTLPVLSDAPVWSDSFVVRQGEFFLCPFSKFGSGPCAFELEVLSPVAGVCVEPCRKPEATSAMPVTF